MVQLHQRALAKLNLTFMRKATIDDLDNVLMLLWRNIDKIAIGEPDYDKVAIHIRELIEDSSSIIMVNDEITAAGAARLHECDLGCGLISYGLWLVSERPREGLAVGQALIKWSKCNDAIPVASATPKLSNFYSRLGMYPREIVFIGEK